MKGEQTVDLFCYRSVSGNHRTPNDKAACKLRLLTSVASIPTEYKKRTSIPACRYTGP